MTVYVVTTVQIHDPEKFAIYSRASVGIADRFGAKTMLSGGVSEILEGDGVIGERVMVRSFESKEAVQTYLDSAEYKATAALRAGTATLTMRLIEQ
jgi:uncharacterized protein (DUF1330 family)